MRANKESFWIFIVLYHSLHKILFMESADQYYNKDNWPLEADRRYVNLPTQVIPSNCYYTIYRGWPKVCQSTCTGKAVKLLLHYI